MGTLRTLQAMAWLVRKDYRSPYVKSFVRMLVNSARGQNLDTVSALFLYARDRIKFVEDPPNVEKVSDFRRTTEAGLGDCDDKAVWLSTALLSLDLPARFVVQSYGSQWDHVFVEFFDSRFFRWVALDPSADGHTGIVGQVGWRQALPTGGYEMRFTI